MSYIFLIIINLIIVFIAWVILYSKIKKNSIPSRIEEYTREVERLIIELNRAVEDVVSISEERVDELKSLINQATKIIDKAKNVKNLKIEKSDISNTSYSDKMQKTVDSGNKIENNSKTNQSAKELVKKNKDKKESQIKIEESSLIEKTRHLVTMGYSVEEIAKMLGITPAEVDFLKSLSIGKT